MTDLGKYMRWQDSLKHNKKMLDEITKETKKTNTEYQKYLLKNPFKEQKTLLANRKKKFIDRIMELVEQGVEKYDGK